MKKLLRIGTRFSKLALWQANYVKDFLQKNFDNFEIELVKISTTGDLNLNDSIESFGGKNVFVKEIEESLLKREIDLAVHSYKDLPVNLPEGLEIISTSNREDPRDALISEKKQNLQSLNSGSILGTGSSRRSEQLKAIREDLEIVPIRGNIDTRIKKLKEGMYDAIILAYAGMKYLDFENEISEIFSADEIIPSCLLYTSPSPRDS